MPTLSAKFCAFSLTQWHKGHDYHASHAGIPKGFKLVAGSVQIRHLELIAA